MTSLRTSELAADRQRDCKTPQSNRPPGRLATMLAGISAAVCVERASERPAEGESCARIGARCELIKRRGHWRLHREISTRAANALPVGAAKPALRNWALGPLAQVENCNPKRLPRLQQSNINDPRFAAQFASSSKARSLLLTDRQSHTHTHTKLSFFFFNLKLPPLCRKLDLHVVPRAGGFCGLAARASERVATFASARDTSTLLDDDDDPSSLQVNYRLEWARIRCRRFNFGSVSGYQSAYRRCVAFWFRFRFWLWFRLHRLGDARSDGLIN